MFIEFLRRHKLVYQIISSSIRILGYVNQLVPKNENKILFVDTLRDFLDDNTEAMYHWLKSNQYDKKYNLQCYVALQKNNFNTEYRNLSLIEVLYAYMTSKYVFNSFGGFKIQYSKTQKVFNLWHGTPVKVIGKYVKFVGRGYIDKNINNFTYLLATSDFFKPKMADAFNCSQEKVIVAGQPRNDYLFSEEDTLYKLGINRQKYKKTVLWMPTFRKSKNGEMCDSTFLSDETLLPIINTLNKLKEVDSFLRQKSMLLIIKIHPYAFSFVKAQEFTNIYTLTNNDLIQHGIKLYEFIKDFDALLTDYSSVYVDYLLLDRPIGFTVDDYEEYEQKRGFMLENAIQYLPGHHIYDYDDLLKYFDDIWKNHDEYQDDRHKINKFFNKYHDNKNCERIAEFLGIKI